MKEKQTEHTKVQELRKCPEFAHLDDCMAQNVIDAIREFCGIIVSEYDSFGANPNLNQLGKAENHTTRKTKKPDL